MSVIVCSATCWSCKFGSCYDEPTPHTYADADDIDVTPRLAAMSPDELAVEAPCACVCAGGKGGCQFF